MPQALEQADGRWAWVVLLASLVTQALTLGFPSCIGIFFTDLQRDFQASNTETSWFPSIMGATIHGGGPLCGILIKRFGCRVTMILGGVLASLGMVVSTFSASLTHLFITAGLITGLLLDKTNDFSYVFYLSSAFLISGALFMGVGFYAEEKKKKKKKKQKQQLKRDGQAKMEDATSEMTSMCALTSEDKDSAKRQPYPENTYVTNV
ncbi:monocarboxylate transporter 6 isoform X2 [Apodemus sylvaticus]|uniref:monocarboxylate transporter 6 isoform X2 n=1 Tax=Apodemus sylvaticus TaxID=10129 RepID=UPI0022422248|nr:monocarboxylate transporter 6 isoform X2 [Apodemus sylvaticus]